MNTETLTNWKFYNKQMDRFSPSGYLFVVFPNADKLARAKRDLILEGWSPQDLIDFTGQDLLESDDELMAHRSLLSVVLSKFTNRDQVYHDALKQGAQSFLQVLARLRSYQPSSRYRRRVDGRSLELHSAIRHPLLQSNRSLAPGGLPDRPKSAR